MGAALPMQCRHFGIGAGVVTGAPGLLLRAVLPTYSPGVGKAGKQSIGIVSSGSRTIGRLPENSSKQFLHFRAHIVGTHEGFAY